MNGESIFLLRGVGFVVAGALFWIVYFDLKDRLQPEPRRRLLTAFLLGALAAACSALVYEIGMLLGLPDSPGEGHAAILAYCLGLIGPVEEGLKFAVAALVVTRWPEFDEPVDGVIYAGAVAIGFAALENIVYLAHLSWIEHLARSMTSPITHSLFAAVWGYGLSRARFTARTRRGVLLWCGTTLAAASALHGLYDYALFAWDATFLAAMIVFSLWIAMAWQIRRLLREHPPAPQA